MNWKIVENCVVLLVTAMNNWKINILDVWVLMSNGCLYCTHYFAELLLGPNYLSGRRGGLMVSELDSV